MSSARFIALWPERDGQPRMPITVSGRLVVDTEQAWQGFGIQHDGLIRVPADTLGYRVSMLGSPAAKHVKWWIAEDLA